MSEVTETSSYAVPAAKLWAFVADFGGIDKFMDGIDHCVVEGEGVGAKRTIPVGDAEIVESLDVLDHEKFTLTYSILSGPIPFKDYSATMVVTEDSEDSCTLTWTGTFEPNGVSNEKAEKIARGIYRGGINSYRKALGL